jgi:chloramphenicol 3-O-phosphotransferase
MTASRDEAEDRENVDSQENEVDEGGNQSDDMGVAKPSAELNEVEEETVDLPDGDYLLPENARVIAAASRARLIILAGAVGSGKTTLLASIYETFQKGPYAGYNFAGSRTLPGLERRCHLARVASMRTAADTEHTPLKDDVTLLHLRLRDTEHCNEPRDLLFTDLAGERFRMARDSTEECKKLTILLRGDHFALLIDGERLASRQQRNGAYITGRSVLRSCLDAGMLSSASFVDILFTKWDLVMENMDTDLEDFLKMAKSRLQDDFEGRVARLRFFDVAARPRGVSLPFAFNLDRCFPAWVEDFPERSFHTPTSTIDQNTLREIDRFGQLTAVTRREDST